MDYLEEIKKEYPDIKAHNEDDEDWDGMGFECLSKNDLDQAAVFFKKLSLSQPQHHSGCEGLAYISYKLKNKEKALWFMENSIEMAKEFLKDGSIDVEVIDQMTDNLKNMQNDQDLNEWWK